MEYSQSDPKFAAQPAEFFQHGPGPGQRQIEDHLGAHFAAGFDAETFRADLRTVYAVTRCLEIISEASRRLPDEI